MRNILKYTLSTVIIFFMIAGCDTEELHELNINPQAVNEIDVNYLLASASLSIASGGAEGDNRYIDWRTNLGYGGGLIQQLTTSGSISGNGNYYTENIESNTAPWTFGYGGVLKNCVEVIKQTGPGGYAEGIALNARSAARILRVWNFQRLTDFYGNIPYTQANAGLDGNFFPEYDNQSDIYPDLLRELGEAIDSLNTSHSDDGFAGNDMLYQGDIEKWKKFGNTLMLRMAMRVSNVDAGLASQYVTRAMQAPGPMETNDDNLWVPMDVGPSEWQNQNGISRAFYPGDGGNQSTLGEPFINFLKGSDPASTADDDPRLMVLSGGIFDWTASDLIMIDNDPLNQRGAPPGYYENEIEADLGFDITWNLYWSRINVLMLDDNDPYMVMNAAEAHLLMAEALERGIGSGIGGTAADHYNAGVTAAMTMYAPFDPALAVDPAAVATYLATYPYGAGGVTGSESALEQIGYQLWASKFMNWWEAWCDWRRTGYPSLVEFTSNTQNVSGGAIFRRLRYPDGEVAVNPNFNQASDNNYTSRVWWDVGN
jgi:hypothetical protein